MDPGGQKSTFAQKLETNFFDQHWPKMIPRGLKSIFRRKMIISNFLPKIDPGGQKPIFCQKNESSISQTKLAKIWSLEVSNGFFVEKLTIQISYQKWTLEVKNRFLVKKLII